LPYWRCSVGAGLDQDQVTVTSVMGCLHDPANVQQTSSKCRPIQNTRANAGCLLDRVNTLLCWQKKVSGFKLVETKAI